MSASLTALDGSAPTAVASTTEAPAAAPPWHDEYGYYKNAGKAQTQWSQRAYSSGLFACFDDADSCCLGWFAPCYLSARVMNEVKGLPDVDETWCGIGCVPLVCCGCVFCLVAEIWVARDAVHQTYHIEEDSWKTILLMCFCTSCAACQDAREVRLRRGTLLAPRPATAAAAAASPAVSTSPSAPLLVKS